MLKFIYISKYMDIFKTSFFPIDEIVIKVRNPNVTFGFQTFEMFNYLVRYLKIYMISNTWTGLLPVLKKETPNSSVHVG